MQPNIRRGIPVYCSPKSTAGSGGSIHYYYYYYYRFGLTHAPVCRVVPPTVKALKHTPSLQGKTHETAETTAAHEEEMEQVWGVFFRYVEYCITAPLLFLAVVCLLVVDAPAW